MCPVTLPLVFPLKYLALHTTTALRPSVSNYIGLVHLNKLQTWVSPSVKLYWPPLSQQPPSTSTINVRPCLPIWQVGAHCSLDRYIESILICTKYQQLTSSRSMGVGLCILFQVVVVCRLDLYIASLLISPKYVVSKRRMYLFQLPSPISTRSVGVCLLVKSPRTCKTVSQLATLFVFK